MTRVIAVSDSHGAADSLRWVLTHEKADALIYLGDGLRDLDEAMDAKPKGMRVYRVRGNCDLLDDGSKYDEYLEIEGYKIWLTHGHRYIERNVQADLGYWAKQLGQDIVVFGHTHVPMAEYYAETLLVNPGSPSRPRGGSEPCFAVLTLQAGQTPQVEFFKV